MSHGQSQSESTCRPFTGTADSSRDLLGHTRISRCDATAPLPETVPVSRVPAAESVLPRPPIYGWQTNVGHCDHRAANGVCIHGFRRAHATLGHGRPLVGILKGHLSTDEARIR